MERGVDGSVIGYGIPVAGVPVGDNAYVQQYLRLKAAKAVSKIDKVTTVLQPLHLQALHCSIYDGLSQLFIHQVQHCYPSEVLAAAAIVDASITRAARACLGDQVIADPYAAERLRLPARKFGGGIRSSADLAPAAFAGAVCRAFPRMLPRLGLDGAVLSGFLPQLAPFLGDGSFDANAVNARFAALVRSGSRLGTELSTAWAGMQAEVQEPTGMLRHPVEAAGGADLAYVQRELTGIREAARFQRLDVTLRSLPDGDMRRAAWVNSDRFSTTWVSSWPSLDCRVTSSKFAEIVARYFGVASPACAGLIGQSIGTTRQRLDPHGARLTAAGFPGDGFRKQHDTIKWRLSEDMREMGVRSRTEVYGLFAALLPQSAQDEVAKWPRRKRQGLVPDFVAAIPDELHTPAEVVDELFELKTLHYGSTTYPSGSDARCAAVTRRAEAIPGEQAAKARRLDQEFCGATPGEIGPGGRKLAAFGPVRGLVFGHWAEASGHVDALLAGCAQCGIG